MSRPIRIYPKRPLQVFIQERREMAGLTQQQLADRLGTSAGTVSRWESPKLGKRRVPSSEVLAAIAEALNIDISLLFSPPEENDLGRRIKRLPKNDRDIFETILDAFER